MIPLNVDPLLLLLRDLKQAKKSKKRFERGTYIPPLETLCCITSLIQVCGKNRWTIIVLSTFVWKK